MLEWGSLTLFLYILMRMSGFVLLNPLFGRNNVPGIYKAGFIMLLTVVVASTYTGAGVEVPNTVVEFCLRAFLELGLGFLLAVIMQFFFYRYANGYEYGQHLRRWHANPADYHGQSA